MKVSELPLALYTSAKVRELDQLAIKQLPIAAYKLMNLAGEAAFNVLQENWPEATTIEVCCGPGNNGGDGFVLARLAKAHGLNVKVFSVGQNETKFSEETKQARADWLAVGKEIIPFQGQHLTADVIVDALLGTGSRSPLAPEFQQVIEIINQSQRPVLAIDLPSGLNADTGEHEEVVKATATITFVGMKLGLITGPGIDVVGKLFFDDLGVPSTRFSEVKPIATRIDYQTLISQMPHRRLSAHKGDNGHVCVIGAGQVNYSGAACLAAEAALRAGCGLASLVVAPESLPLLARGPCELMCYGAKDPEAVLALLNRITVIVLGPGLSQTPWAESFFKAALKTTKPLVVDADGLNWLARHPQKREQWILTPHPGEAARLLDCDTLSIQKDRIAAVKALHKKYGGIIVLKGAGTLVFDGNSLFVNQGGIPALGTGGTGDVLAGLIGGLVSQGLSLFFAAKLGVSVHSEAAQLEQSFGARGMLASDLFLHIRSLLNPIEE